MFSPKDGYHQRQSNIRELKKNPGLGLIGLDLKKPQGM